MNCLLPQGALGSRQNRFAIYIWAFFMVFYFCPSYEHNQGDEVDVDRYKSLLKETFRSMIYSL